jgi:diaminopimelate epimerase
MLFFYQYSLHRKHSSKPLQEYKKYHNIYRFQSKMFAIKIIYRKNDYLSLFLLSFWHKIRNFTFLKPFAMKLSQKQPKIYHFATSTKTIQTKRKIHLQKSNHIIYLYTMIKFTKMQGAGNDYVYINCFEEVVEQPEILVTKISDRHKGIGSDGLVLIMPSETCDFRMRMFNPDGSESQMCGNASRCIGKYVYDNGLTDKTKISLETKAGIKYLQLYIKDEKVEKVCVDMGMPVLKASSIPVNSTEEQIIDYTVDFEPEKYAITCVSMGNPHTVIFAKDIKRLSLEREGKKIENFRLFPERTNVEFVELISPNKANVRVWERGTGETQACGTGACAVLVAGVLTGQLNRKATITLPGGDLDIEWNTNDNHIYMTGDAVTVFEGKLNF